MDLLVRRDAAKPPARKHLPRRLLHGVGSDGEEDVARQLHQQEAQLLGRRPRQRLADEAVRGLQLRRQPAPGPAAVKLIATFALASGLAVAGPAQAGVLEIGDDGTVKTLGDTPGATWTTDDQQEVTAEASDDIVIPDKAVTVLADRGWSGGYAQAMVEIAKANDISPYLLEAVVWQESRWNPAARSRAGAIGLAQLMPGTARDLGVDPNDPLQNLSGGARYLRQQLNRFDGNVEKALAAYNAGPGRVMTAGGIPSIPETQAYVRAIVARLAANSTLEGERQ
ncbi:lytic transglycosylase domain-containing protein [Sphingomonas daechungensis]|uniref:Lytic transglycosylase domain-containing protein n=1 Tax=Sphingomonas daechungensis TaxID=1176646 RepID=A0ABX6T0I7_9SPHN|nr:lytic transglycosylase domain-containing protein [Sphingomonas daechungensis]